MTREEAKSCIRTIELLRRLAFNVHGVMDVIDAQNCDKIIALLSQEPCEDCISRVGAMRAITDEWVRGEAHSGGIHGGALQLAACNPGTACNDGRVGHDHGAGRKRGEWMNYFVQLYTCESGAIGRIVIPENATEDDLLAIKDFLEIVVRERLKRLKKTQTQVESEGEG